MIDLNIVTIKNAWQFVCDPQEPKLLDSDKYCSSRDIFIARLDKLRIILEQRTKDTNLTSLLTAVVGEIGNNSFDHNLGNWRDLPGVYFDYDLEKKIIVLVDRGQGITATIQKIKPEIDDDQKAIQVAFTEIISGRAPEQRGNGLKFVSKVMQENQWELLFYSGNAKAAIDEPDYQLVFDNDEQNIQGTLAIISF